MPNYQPLVNESLTFFTLQNALFAEDVGVLDSICETNDTMSGDNLNNEITANNSSLHLEIAEQPADTFRYRYKSEKGSHGGIKGERSSRTLKTHPTVKVVNCPTYLKEKIVIKVSLYTNEEEPKPHVYELTGKNAGGVELDENYLAEFKSLAICTRKKEEVTDILKERRRDYYYALQGLACDEDAVEKDAAEEMKNFMLDSAKLCFEAFSRDDLRNPLCQKIFSNPINNQKSAATGDLKIVRLSHCSGKCSGGDDIILLCEKVKKEDIKVRFFEEESDWEAFGEFNPADIHHQVAIVLKTPPYKELNVNKDVFIQLFRPSDTKFSEQYKFKYIPDEDDRALLNKKIKNTQGASRVQNECSEISRKRRRIHIENVKNSSFDLEYSSVMDSPESIANDDISPLEMLKNLGLDLEDMDLELGFSQMNELLNDNENLTPEDQMGNFAYDGPSEVPNYAMPQCNNSVVEADGMNDILYSMDSLSLAGQCCGRGTEIERASSDFVTGLKQILQSRDKRTLLHYAAGLVPLQDEEGNSLLHLGIMEQSENWNFILKMVKLSSEDLINSQNKFKETPLHLAVKGNHIEILLLLLAKGGDPNLSDKSGNNCLHLAAKYGHIRCLKVLLPTSVDGRTWRHVIRDIDAINYEGMSALHNAVIGSFKECVDFLLNSKADVNLSELKGGKTPLHLALGCPSLLQTILKQSNVDIHAEDYGGCTALELACLKSGQPFEVVSGELEDDEEKIAQFLESCGEWKDDGLSSEEESGEFEDAVEELSSVPSGEAVSVSVHACTNEKKSNLMLIEEELHMYLDRDENWKKLADLIGLDTRCVALLDEGGSPGQTVLRKTKDLYHPCHLQTMIEALKLAGLEEGVQILQKNF